MEELDTTTDRVETGWIEIDGWKPELFDLIFLVGGGGSRILLAHVDHAANIKFGQFRNVPFEWECAEEDIWIYLVPPVAPMQDSAQEVVPGEGGCEKCAGEEGPHGGLESLVDKRVGISASIAVDGGYYVGRQIDMGAIIANG